MINRTIVCSPFSEKLALFSKRKIDECAMKFKIKFYFFIQKKIVDTQLLNQVTFFLITFFSLN